MIRQQVEMLKLQVPKKPNLAPVKQPVKIQENASSESSSIQQPNHATLCEIQKIFEAAKARNDSENKKTSSVHPTSDERHTQLEQSGTEVPDYVSGIHVVDFQCICF